MKWVDDMTITRYMRHGDTMFLEYTQYKWVEVTRYFDSFMVTTSSGQYFPDASDEDVFDLLMKYPLVLEIRHYKKGSLRFSCFYKDYSHKRSNYL
jgi:hypothetical protein